MMDSEFSYGLDLYRVRYGDGEVTSLLAQSPDQARGLAETARPGHWCRHARSSKSSSIRHSSNQACKVAGSSVPIDSICIDNLAAQTFRARFSGQSFHITLVTSTMPSTRSC